MKLELFRILLLSIVIIFQLGGLQNFYPQNIKEQNLEDDINDIIVMDIENNSIRTSKPAKICHL